MPEIPRAQGSFTVTDPGPKAPEWIKYPADPVASLVEDLKRVGPNHIACVYAPDGDPEVFNDIQVKDPLYWLRGHKPKARIKVLTGPAILGEDGRGNDLLEYSRLGLLTLARKQYRGYDGGFRIVETEGFGYRALMEFPHSSYTPCSERFVHNLDELPQYRWGMCIAKTSEVENGFVEADRSSTGELLHPLVIPESRFEEMQRVLKSRGRSLDPMVFDHIQSLLLEPAAVSTA